MLNAPEATAVQAARERIVEALIRMARAVQKATIYPDGHPAVPGAVEIFLTALKHAFEDKPVLSIGIASGWGFDTKGWAEGDPGVLAQQISEASSRGEGPDGATVASRVIAVGGALAALPGPVRQGIKKRLGQFIGGLSQEMRAQLLR